jgi:hypothetical protein
MSDAAEVNDEADGLVDLSPDEWAEDGLEDRSSDAPGLDETPQPYFADVDVFVREYLAPTYCRSLEGSQRAWCPEWWRHAEAINRLEALWRAWEHLRLDPATGMSVWWRDHADHQMAALLAPDGPFKGCGTGRGHQPRSSPLPVSAAPPGLFE